MNIEKLVYFDMDGVMADIEKSYDAITDKRKPDGTMLFSLVPDCHAFFRDLPPIYDMLRLWQYVPRERRRILSAVPRSNVEQSSSGKLAFLNIHVEIPAEHVHLVVGKSNKKTFARPGDILIDDWPPNINDWRESGGTGILFTSVDQALAELIVAMEEQV